ncbi:MAG TPA: PAS domain-containing sensor histidine kinase [Bacillus bacterium]|uniref:histidine kinase n=1 Tax=Siminovitchia fordii TaxID=254759 RepID=A0ABQ4K835_9BACI|nr:ATP-binding protein [Siminovitchia fordii]GIN21013.1 sensor histidine kinase ResE [Siminovitchia fordii]HBZ11136.1 PAS domain-containing sensor histidine kinase [Bacillus sp. (in: firmicutes)]
MRLWRSVVGKLWMTILLLVSFVLVILTILLIQFFEKYHVDQIEQNLSDTAEKISGIIESHRNDGLGEEIVFEIVDDPMAVAIAYDKERFHYSPNVNESNKIPSYVFLNDDELSKVFTQQKIIKKELSLSELHESGSRFNNYIVAGVPLHLNDNETGAIFIYQSLGVLKETTKQTANLILLAAGIAIVLTTIFAFFLSTRITAPLRRMREAAFELSKGNFDTRVPFLSHDEIGELAIAFNQMGKRLKFNMNVLRQEKEQLTNILSSMADGVMTFSRDGTILITNPPAERFLQQWPIDGNEANYPIPPEMAELLERAVADEKEHTGELSIQGRYYVVIVSPLYTHDQKSVRGAVAVIRDMTEERRLDKLRIDFVANVSHELRTPIAMLQGYSEAIIDDIAGSEEEKQEIIKIIYDESLRIGRLVNELLDMARMEAGHITLNFEEVDVGVFVERITSKFQTIARDNKIDLKSHIEKEGVLFSLDPDKIEQVLTNLIDNAMRYTHENGKITVTQSVVKGGITISVEDDGTGIPEEDLPFVFERFYKADKARTRGRAGTGLGLAIAKNIVNTHQGQLTVTSKLGEGTTFTLFLPNRS